MEREAGVRFLDSVIAGGAKWRGRAPHDEAGAIHLGFLDDDQHCAGQRHLRLNLPIG